MFNFFEKAIDLIKGKERADWVVSTWKHDHADEYDKFVNGIKKMAEGDMSTAFEMYAMMKTCMPPEAVEYYNIMVRLCNGNLNAIHEMTKLEHAYEIGECAVNGRTLAINIGTGEITLNEKPPKDCLVVKASDVMKKWDALPLYSKAYCKEQYDQVKSNMPVAMRADFLNTILILIKIHYVANLVFMPGMMANLYDKAVNENNGLLFAMYYFVTYDKGLQRMAQIFSKVVNNETPGIDGVTIFKSTIHNITSVSLCNGWDSKESWKDVAESSDNDEAWKEIMHAVSFAKANHSKKVKPKTIGEMLTCKNKKKAQKLISQFLNEYDGMFGTAYLLWILKDADCIAAVTYMDFHRAIELHLNKKIESKKPQERYGLLKNQQDKQNRHKRIWNEVKKIKKTWVPLFAETR